MLGKGKIRSKTSQNRSAGLSNSSALKKDFREYLEAQGKIKADSDADISIFEHASDFKKYLKKEFGAKSSDINSKNLSQILNFDFLRKINNELSKEDEDKTSSSTENEDETTEETSDAADKNSSFDAFNEIFAGLLEDDKFKNALDADGNDKVSYTELSDFLKTISEFDGKGKDVTIDDLLTAVDKISDGSFTTEKEKKASKTSGSKSSGGASGASGGSSPGATTGTSSPYGSNTGLSNVSAKKSDAETKQELEQQIKQKEGEITKQEKQADEKIEQAEKKKDEAMKKAGLKEKEIEQYKQKEQECEKNIKQKETQINDADNNIRNFKTTIQSNENYIKSLEAQVAANNEAASQENGSSQKNDIQSKTSNLEAEIEKLKAENESLQAQMEAEEQKKAQLQEEKQALEEEKANILTNMFEGEDGFGSGLSDETKEGLTKEVQDLDKNISEIKTERDKNIGTIKDEIDELKVQLKDVEEKPKREQFINENSAFDYAEGEKLAELAKQCGGQKNTHGWCLAGVNQTLNAAYGISVCEGSAYMTIDNFDAMAQQGLFENMTNKFANYQELANNCPKGAIIVWDRSSSSPHGHITIFQGPGQGETSDHNASYLYNIGTQFHVYYPTGIKNRSKTHAA